jgi:hypothetical protein
MASYERRTNERHLRNIRKYGPIVSTHTLRLEDLVPAFLDALKDIDRNVYNEYVETGLGNEVTVEDVHDEDSHVYKWRHTDDGLPLAYHLVDELTVALESVCPPGVRFGANPGNASNFGFWPAPCEEHVDKEWPLPECPACQQNVKRLTDDD